MALRVKGAFVQVTTLAPTGHQRSAYYQGAYLPPDTPAEERDHLLSVGLVEEVPDSEAPAPTPTPAEEPPTAGVNVPAVDDPRRVKARAKLPADGSPPPPQAGEDVWVEYAVSKGYAYEAARTAGKDELINLLKG